jgi:hypothetical protein
MARRRGEAAAHAATPSTDPVLRDRDWAAVARDYHISQPYNYAVLDGVLTDTACASVRRQLLNQWGWQYKNWQANELYVRDPDIPEVRAAAELLPQLLPEVLGGLEFVRCWAFMHQRNAGLKVHADNGAVTLDIWLTPDEYNRDPASGGLVFFDVKRDPGMMIHEFNTVEWAEQHFRAHTKGRREVVGYAYNRGILFDAGTFHESDKVDFVAEGVESYRINLSLLFDDPEQFRARRAQYDDADDLGVN